MGSLLSSMSSPLAAFGTQTSAAEAMEPLAVPSSKDGVTSSHMSKILWRGCRWALSPFHHARLWWKRLFRAKGLPGGYKNSWTSGSSGLGVFFTSWILSDRNVSSLASIQLHGTSSKPSVLHQCLNWTWRGSEKKPSTHRLRKLGFADRSFL